LFIDQVADDLRAATSLYLAIATALSALVCLCRWLPLWQPGRALRFASWFGISLSILFLPALGLGLVFVPFAVALRQAARHFDLTSYETHIEVASQVVT
jgi:hypothetical protein